MKMDQLVIAEWRKEMRKIEGRTAKELLGNEAYHRARVNASRKALKRCPILAGYREDEGLPMYHYMLSIRALNCIKLSRISVA